MKYNCGSAVAKVQKYPTLKRNKEMSAGRSTSPASIGRAMFIQANTCYHHHLEPTTIYPQVHEPIRVK